jgi:hypothetical protein
MNLQEQISRIHEMMGVINENTKEDFVFIRTEKFDNTGTINKLPYDGIHCWYIKKTDISKYIEELELWGGNRKDVTIVNPDNKEVYAVDYDQAHKYVMGETNKIPKLQEFDENKHRLRFVKQVGKSMIPYVADKKYQIILI